MNGFLNFRIKILDTQRSAVETNFVQGSNVVSRQAARINFNTSFDIFGESKMAIDDFPKAAKLICRKKHQRAATPMKLGNFAARIEQCAHLGHLLFEIVNVSLSLAVVQGDEIGRASCRE